MEGPRVSGPVLPRHRACASYRRHPAPVGRAVRQHPRSGSLSATEIPLTMSADNRSHSPATPCDPPTAPGPLPYPRTRFGAAHWAGAGALLAGVLLTAAGAAPQPAAKTATDPLSRARASFAAVPLSFEANQGQTDG